MTARQLVPADANTLITFWNTKAKQTLVNQGYVVYDMTLTELQSERASGRYTWFGAFDASNNMRGFIEGITSKSSQKSAWVARFGLDPNISLASIRTHRDDMARALWQQIPLGWIVQVPGVLSTATIAREYLDAHFYINEYGIYEQTSDVLRAI